MRVAKRALSVSYIVGFRSFRILRIMIRQFVTDVSAHHISPMFKGQGVRGGAVG